ncbi:MAG: M48 family metalloprotease [Defluviicoccus sp.]|nr:M48 family metalloprotease [Defluviicoccus sp.]
MRLGRAVIAAAAVAALPAMGPAGCAVNPATGERVFTGGVSGVQEKAVGRKAHPQILGELGPRYEDEELQNYVNSVGQLLARTVERRDLEYTFTIVDSDTVNAFAVPGGYIYITRGLLALFGDEAELAGVLGHELGHITALHYARGRGQAVLAQLGVLAADILARQAGAGGAVRNVLGELSGTAAFAYLRSHSRENEYESDDLGIRYIARAGYDTEGVARMLAKIRAHARLRARLAGRSPDEIDRFDYTATHPAPAKRVRRALENAARTPVRDPMVAREIYLRKIDGLFYGGSPEQGFVRGREFIHPKLRFRFSVPDTFTLHNTPKAVIASGGGAQITLRLHGRGRTLSAAGFLRGRWAGKLSLGRIEEFTVNGQPAAAARAAARSARGAVDVRILVVGSRENRVYETIFVFPRGTGTRLDAAYREIRTSLRELTAREAASYRPRRIEVVEARPGDTQESLARRMAVAKRPLEHFRMLNGLEPRDRIAAGRLLKLVVE